MDVTKGHAVTADKGQSPRARVMWYRRQDVFVWTVGMAFIAVLMLTMFGAGHIRGWDAISGYTHNISKTSRERFLSEPFVQEAGVHGRYGGDCDSRWYYWKLPPHRVSLLSRALFWGGYLLHQISIWSAIYIAQQNKTKLSGKENSKYSNDVSMFNWISLGLNIFFHILHFIITHLTYDGLAQDVSIASSQGSVIVLCNFILLIEYKDRGLFLGWPSSKHKGNVSRIFKLGFKPLQMIRKYHGYGFAWGATYTFWYHPMENTMGHCMGFILTWMFLLQGSLMYTNLHVNRWWRTFQEMFVILHGFTVAVQTSGPEQMGTKLWPMFLFGFSMTFAITQVFTLSVWDRLPAWCRLMPFLAVFASASHAYSWIPDADGKPWVRLGEIFRIPATYYMFTYVAWFTIWLTESVLRKTGIKSIVRGKIGKALWLVLALAVYILFVCVSVMVQYHDWQIHVLLHMVFFVSLFTIGSAISMVFLDISNNISDSRESQKQTKIN